jgi:hypothetical protein
MSGISVLANPQATALALRALSGDPGVVHLWFTQDVLDRYRGRDGWRVMRTNTVGRIRSGEGWTLDFGIADGGHLIHTSASELSQRLPAPERQHWAQHVVTPATSRNFMTMRLAPGSCIDDGDLRDWPSET